MLEQRKFGNKNQQFQIMEVNIEIIKAITKKLAGININEFNSLSKLKVEFDELATELIDLDSDDSDLIVSLKKASEFFNLLNEEDFQTDDKQKINESKAIISHFTRELSTTLVKWRKQLGML
jgi:hypothetical protein